MKPSDLIFATIGLPMGIIQLAGAEGRWLRTKWRFPRTRFGRGANADEECSFEEGVVIHRHVTLSRTTIGAYSYVADNSTLWNCTIGRYCSIGGDVRIGLGLHPTRDVISTYPGFYSPRPGVPISFRVDPTVVEHRSVSIGNDVWIGTRAMLMDGITVGDGAIIGAGSIVTRDVPPYCVAAGAPARKVRVRFTEEQICALLEFAWWNRGVEFCHRRADAFGAPRDFFESLAAQTDIERPQPSFGHSCTVPTSVD
jgi:acetyltransferase-like isoleucine patch superfamily enzyme